MIDTLVHECSQNSSSSLDNSSYSNHSHRSLGACSCTNLYICTLGCRVDCSCYRNNPFKALTLAGTFHQLNNTSWGRRDKRGHWSQSFFLLIPSVVFRGWDGWSRGSVRLSYYDYRSQPRSTEMLNNGTSCWWKVLSLRALGTVGLPT